MDRQLGRFGGEIYALTRIVVGFLFACHGAQKVFGLLGLFGFAEPGMSAGMAWAAGLIELVGGAMIALGWLTSWAAFICSGQMAVAYFMVHQGNGLLPIANGGEKAALYAWIFLLIAARGSGRWSVDSARS